MTDWSQQMRERSVVETQYSTTDRLERRISIWSPGPDGIDPTALLRDSIVALHPRHAVEIGCGTGTLAAQVCRQLPSCDYLATDRSPAMVAATAAHGVRAEVSDAAALPVPDGWADVVVAAWMLYHVPDLHAVLREVTRVLAPGGTFLAVTNGDTHLATLLADVGVGPAQTQFSSENGLVALEEHFQTVTRRDVHTLATFPDHEAATAYLATIDPGLAGALPDFEGARQDAGYTTIFTARCAAGLPGDRSADGRTRHTSAALGLRPCPRS